MTERHPLVLTLVLAGVQLLAVLDGLAVSLALPHVGAELHLGAAGRAWVLNSTSLALAGGLLVAGRVADVLGRRPVFLGGVLLLALGSVVCATAPSAALLMVGRVVIGLGAAVAYPSALALTGSLFPDEPWRTRAFAASAVSGASGALGGAVYGGVVTELLGWRWIFWLTVPITLLLAAAAQWVLPPDARDAVRRPRRLDAVGAALATVAVTAFVTAVIGLGTGSAPDLVVAASFLLALAGAGATWAWERRAPDPLLPAEVTRSRRLLGGAGGIAANSALWSVVVFVLSQQLQAAGWSPAAAGVAVLPCSAGIVVGGVVVVPRLARRIGSVRTAVVGLGAGAGSVGVLAAVPDEPAAAWLVAPLLVLGFGLAAASTGLKEHTLRDAPAGAEAVSAAVFESSTHVGGAVSVAAYATVLATAGPAPAYAVAAGLGAAGAGWVGVLQGRRDVPTGPRAGRPR